MSQCKKFLESVPTKKLGTSDDIRHAIEFLVLSEYTNGSVITIDGYGVILSRFIMQMRPNFGEEEKKPSQNIWKKMVS